MVTKTLTACLVALTVSMMFAGCTSSKAAPEPSPPPVTTTSRAAPPPPTTAAAPPPKPLPAVVYNQTAAYTMDNAPGFPSFNVTTSWTTLKIEYFLNATSSCYLIGSEPPTGLGTGPAPAITITPPKSSPFSFELPPGPGSCGTENGAVKHDVAEMANELGTWTVTVSGRGQNLDLAIVVRGA